MRYLISYIFGFISFPIITILVLKVWGLLSNRKAKEISNKSEISNELKTLYNQKSKKLLILVIKENGFEYRINKKIYKSQNNSLELEIRLDITNRKYYEKIISSLNKQSFEYKIKYSPKLKLPNRIILNFKEIGVLSITPLTDIIIKLTQSITNQNRNILLTEFCETFYWINNPHKRSFS